MQDYKRSFIEFMLSAGVLRFGEFTTKSGRLSPYFINTGLYRTGAQISKLGQYYATCILENFDNIKSASADTPELALFGPAYKGITLACAASVSLWRDNGIDIPFCFNRKEAKDHGEGGTLIGAAIGKGTRVIIVEDVMTAGTALRETLPIIKATGATATEMVISVDRCERGAGGATAVEEAEKTLGVTVRSIITVHDLIEYLTEKGEREIVTKMNAYLDKYCAK